MSPLVKSAVIAVLLAAAISDRLNLADKLNHFTRQLDRISISLGLPLEP